MAYLLGNQACMESLQSDVQDLQETLGKVLSRVGPFSAQSWKFPDKLALDIDVDDLLDLYDCSGESDDGEERQVAHIALYELVIDRLVVLVQALSKFCNTNLGGSQIHKQNKPESQSLASSVGLVIKEHWSHMTSLYSLHQQMMSEHSSMKCKILELEKKLGPIPSSTKQEENKYPDTNRGGLVTPGMIGLIPPNTADLVLMGYEPTPPRSSLISKDVSAKSCQTYESAFVPCESCDVVQKRMREAGDLVIKVCMDQSLPCSLKKFKSQVTHVNYLSFNDVCRWMSEQNKDIARIGKQIEVLQGIIDPMKADVNKCEQRTRTAEEKAKMCEKNLIEEKENQTILRRQLEKKMKEQEQQHQELMDEEERQKGHLKRCKDKLETEVKELGQELEEKLGRLSELKSEVRQLKESLDSKHGVEQKAAQLQQEVTDLKVQVTELTEQVEASTKALTREQGKCKSVSKHNESLQAKQTGLLSRMEVLGTENEELAHQVSSLEEEKTALEDKVMTLKVEVKQQRKKAKESQIIIKNLEAEKSSLEQKIEETKTSIKKLENDLEEMREREKLLIEYPDLNGPVNTDFQGTGDVSLDMQNQVKANYVRIEVLEKQNTSLQESIRKIDNLKQEQQHQQSHCPPRMEPVPLWRTDAVYVGSHGNNSNKMADQSYRREHSGEGSRSTTSTSHRPPKLRQHAWTNEMSPPEVEPSTLTQEEFIVGRTFTPNTPKHKRMDSPTKQNRPSSAKYASTMAPVNATAIGAYAQMKKALGVLSTKDSRPKARPPSGRHQSVHVPHSDHGIVGDQRDEVHTPFSCPKCDKMYIKSRDLDIHLTYCAN